MKHQIFIKMRLKNLLAIALIIGSSYSTQGQEKENFVKKIAKKVFSSDSSNNRSSSFMALPAVAYAQETGFEYGIASTYNFYLDKNDINSKTSNINLIATLTTKSQKKINITSDIWTKNNEYHILTDIRLRDWPFNYYGIGNDTWQKDQDNIEQTLYRIKVDVEKKITKKLYIGLNTNYDNYKFKDLEPGGIYDISNIIGKEGGQFLAFGASALYDSRDVTTYSSKGFYGRLKYAYSPNIFGKENFIGSLTEVDLRGYYPIQEKLIIAAQGVYRGTFGKNTPIYVMRDLGGDMTMRGYYLGRYKDNNYITAQAELRYRFHPRLGVVGFLGTGSTFSKTQSPRLVPSYGLGGRYFFSLEHKTSIRLDYAFGEKRPGEQRQSGFYLSLSESF